MPVPPFPQEVRALMDTVTYHVESVRDYIACPGSPGQPSSHRMRNICHHTRLAFNATTTLRRVLTDYLISCNNQCDHDYVLTDYYTDAGDGRTTYEYDCRICGNSDVTWGRLPLYVAIPDIPEYQPLIHRRIQQTQPATPTRSAAN